MPSPKYCAGTSRRWTTSPFQLHLADGRSAIQAGAPVEKAVQELQTLRERIAIVRKGADDGTTGRLGPAGGEAN
jgi:hypothetical protein